jgi:predicted O-methyltransferase YrrM
MGINTMNKWSQDLRLDIRTNTSFDDRDSPYVSPPDVVEISEVNRQAITNKFLLIRDKAKAILEIGVANNVDKSFAYCFLNNKKKETIYIGIDLDDKSFLNNKENNIYTIKNDSSNYDQNIRIINAIGVKQFDFIFIDGLHSINQCYKDWEYTNILSDNGIVAFHDVNYHPGPYQFIRALDKNKWFVEEDICPAHNDWGIGCARKKQPTL